MSKTLILIACIIGTVASQVSAQPPVYHESVPIPTLTNLPAFQTGTRLVFLGDSITDMKRGRNERDRNHYLGHSFVFMLAGHLGVAMPEAQLDFYNRGISGNTVAALRRRWQKDAIEMRPDVLTILIGTNDVGKGVKPDAFESDYRAILEASRAANPELKVILLDPFVLQSGGLKDDRAWRSRRTATDQLRSVVARLATEYDAVHIKLQDIFDAAANAVSPEHWLWDGIHPLPQGHELIARHWLKAVSARWPQDGEAADAAFSPARYNVVWDSPSNDQSGSMPLGNGSTGLNAWIEPNGDLVFYISRTDSWGGNGRLLKLGRVRITLEPAPATDDFLQTLSLEDGTLKARCGETDIRLWVDANHSVIHAEISGAKPSTASAAVELWRNGNDTDTVLETLEGQIGWYHRNLYSDEPAKLAETQGLGDFKRTDPLLHRTFGAVIKAAGAQRIDDTHLRSASAKSHRFDIYVAAKHPATPDQWLATLAQTVTETESKSFKNRRAAHEAWWKSFWQRSWIHATPGSAKTAKKSLVPANSLNFRLGIDPTGGNKLSGGIGRTTLLKRALRNAEIKKLAKSQAGPIHVSPDDILFSGVPALHSEIKDSATWTDTSALTAELWIRQNTAGSMRILDKTMPGSSDGFLLDTHPQNSLRLIVGDGHFSASDCLKAGQWHHVAVVLDADARRVELYLDGKQVAGRDREESLEEPYVVSRAYALQRYINACAARGAYPIKFNGSIFTVAHEGKPHDADYRQWGSAYWWQNTRMPYMGMCTSGDVEMTDALYTMYCQDLLEYHKHRAKIHTGHAGLYIPETMHFYGNHRMADYGKTPFAERTDKLQESPWHKWEWVAGLELSFMMFDRYEHTLDETFLKETILPFTHEVLTFFDLHYKTGTDGKLVMHPSQALETWWECTNPMPEVAGLHAVIDRLLALPDALTNPKMRAYWADVKSKVPDLPTRDVDGTRMFAPAAKFANCRNSEVPELYAVYPFRLCSLEQGNVQLGIEALNNRGPKGYQGWRQDDIFMAYLGLTEQAREYVVNRASTKHDGSRFPAFWGPNMDWIPDQTHGGVLMKAFQSMLLQTDGKKIYLLPAWPSDWNAEFKLHAPYKTVLEGRVENGKLVDLNVTPEARRKDVIFEITSKETPMTIDEKTMKKWSAPFREWHYHPNHVIPAKPNIKGFEEVRSTDVPTIFQMPGDDKWYMTFIGYDGKGYQSFVAESDDLLNWTNMRLAMGFGKKGDFDFGGCVLGAYLYEDYGIKARRTLKKRDGKYWSLYGSYAKQGGYEIDPGYEGVAASLDGMTWKRAKDQYILSIHEPDVGDWEKDCIYMPWLVEHDGQFYNFYNAKKMPEWIEQIGLATSSDLLNWKRYAENPVIRVRPGGYDAKFCADGKVFRDGDHWVMFYFGVGRGGAHIMAAYSLDLIHWVADPEPLYKAGGHPLGLDKKHAHKISLVWNPVNETYYMFYNAVGNQGRGIGLITSKPLVQRQ